MKKSLSLLVPLFLFAGCPGEADLTLEDEVTEYAPLFNKQPLDLACQELSKLCASSNKGCKAYTLFCTNKKGDGGGWFAKDGGFAPPSTKDPKQLICDNLQKACASFPMACGIYNMHCKWDGGFLPQLDFKIPKMPDFKLPKMPDLKLPKLPKVPDFGLPGLPGLPDKTKCCATLLACIQQNNAACPGAKSDCMGLPGFMNLSMLKMVHKAFCN